MPYIFNPFTGTLDDSTPGPAGTVSAAGSGTAALPGISFAGDPNTGLYSPGADQVAISTNGTGRLFVDASGQVGINSSPQSGFGLKISPVVGQSSALLSLVAGTNTAFSRIDLGDSDATDVGRIVYNHANNVLELRTNGGPGVFIDSSGNIAFGSGGTSDDNTYIGHPAGDTITITTNGSERLRVDSSGRLGLGTSSPSALLTIEANSTNTSFATTNHPAETAGILSRNVSNTPGNYQALTLLANNGSSAQSASLVVQSVAAGTPPEIHLTQRTGFNVNTTRLMVASSGNVGIGTTSPTALLDISSGGNGLILGADFAATTRTDATTKVARIACPHYTTAEEGLALVVASSESANNYVNIGGGSGALNAATDVRVFTGSTTTTTTGTERARIDSSGRVLIGTSSSRTGYRLQVEGTLFEEASVSIVRNAENAAGGSLSFRKSRGSSAGSYTTVVAEDGLGNIFFSGANGTSDLTAAQISAFVDGEPNTSGDSTDMPGRLVFSVTADGSASPTEALRITNDRYVRLASGSGGIQFNGDTAAANALDDYEEGTFTPTIAGTTAAGTATYTTQAGKYTKVGNTVVVTCRLDWSLHTGTGSIYIAGLPFAPAGQNTVGGIFCGSLSFTDAITPRILTGQTRVYPYSLNSGGAATLVNIVAAGAFDCTITYYTS
jgi:hypothetical protein